VQRVSAKGISPFTQPKWGLKRFAQSYSGIRIWEGLSNYCTVHTVEYIAIIPDPKYSRKLFCVRYSILIHLPPPLRFHCVGGCRDRTQDCCDFSIDSQTTWLDLRYLPPYNHAKFLQIYSALVCTALWYFKALLFDERHSMQVLKDSR